jgi:glycosyltransferase involved in cell wall biosynthesis
MGALGIPFIFGPVGGGETMPAKLRRGLPWASRFRESLRNFGNAMVKVDPLMHFTFSRASVIACTTNETRQRIPARFHHKCIVLQTIGVDVDDRPIAQVPATDGPRFLFVGRLLYWKGLHLVLRALAEVRECLPSVRLKVIGEGSDLPWLKRVAEQCGVADIVDWIPWMPREEIFREYHNNTAFVFPSLHDSGGLVVLEALAAGLPVICLNLGGPGANVNSSCGVIVEATHSDEGTVRRSLAEAMIALASKPELRDALVSNCVPRARQLSWERAVEGLYVPAEQNCNRC